MIENNETIIQQKCKSESPKVFRKPFLFQIAFFLKGENLMNLRMKQHQEKNANSKFLQFLDDFVFECTRMHGLLIYSKMLQS